MLDLGPRPWCSLPEAIGCPKGGGDPRDRLWIKGQAPIRQSIISAILTRQMCTSCPQERIGQDVTVIHERLSLATREPIEVRAHQLDALNDTSRRATGRTHEFAVTVSFTGRKPVDIAPKSNKQAIRLLLLEHSHQHSSTQCRDLF